MLALELVDKMVDHSVVEVLSSQVSVTSGRLHLEDALLDGQDGHIKSTTAQIENEHVALGGALLFVQTIGNGGGGGLVNDTQDIKTGNNTGVLGGLTLRVVKVGGNSDYSIVNGVTQIGLGGLLHLGQNHGGHLLGCEGLGLILVLDLELRTAGGIHNLEGPMLHVALHGGVLKFTADETLGVENCVGWVDSDLVLGWVSDETLSVCEGDI